MKNAIIFMLVYSFFCFLSPGLMATEQEQLMVSAAASLRNVMEASGKR
jgi:ABC-type molybdate transport system substrate-binding protein